VRDNNLEIGLQNAACKCRLQKWNEALSVQMSLPPNGLSKIYFFEVEEAVELQ
jgi:hypothetical protein